MLMALEGLFVRRRVVVRASVMFKIPTLGQLAIICFIEAHVTTLRPPQHVCGQMLCVNLPKDTSMSFLSMCRVSAWVLLILVPTLWLGAQPPLASSPQLPIIADEPRTIDPIEVLPSPLAAVATHDFVDSSLCEVVAWLQTEQRMVVLPNKKALAES
jgi:hypothetical protein